MFDIGFTELMFIGVVALIVIGPEKLPKVARTIGHLFGRAQRYITDVKSEINREMEIEELRKLQSEMQGAARKFETDVQKGVRDTENSIRKETKKVEVEFENQGSEGPAKPAGPEPEPKYEDLVAPKSNPPVPDAPSENKPT